MLGQTMDGKYQIVRLLGQGGMGAVYEAAHTGTGRRVALKVIIAETVSRDAILRFQREARAAGVIESQHIVQVLDTGIDRERGLPFMVMEYLVGEDLQKLCERIGALGPELAMRVVAQACNGLHKAHEAHVVHRDGDVRPVRVRRRCVHHSLPGGRRLCGFWLLPERNLPEQKRRRRRVQLGRAVREQFLS